MWAEITLARLRTAFGGIKRGEIKGRVQGDELYVRRLPGYLFDDGGRLQLACGLARIVIRHGVTRGVMVAIVTIQQYNRAALVVPRIGGRASVRAADRERKNPAKQCEHCGGAEPADFCERDHD
ncbi:hypothetical protein EGT07_11030 [Herbaspirillum sp. HC18]|nr:hypothetical protein EGT07_11030 [Herbaspirillum sp. HC18]